MRYVQLCSCKPYVARNMHIQWGRESSLYVEHGWSQCHTICFMIYGSSGILTLKNHPRLSFYIDMHTSYICVFMHRHAYTCIHGHMHTHKYIHKSIKIERFIHCTSYSSFLILLSSFGNLCISIHIVQKRWFFYNDDIIPLINWQSPGVVRHEQRHGFQDIDNEMLLYELGH